MRSEETEETEGSDYTAEDGGCGEEGGEKEVGVFVDEGLEGVHFVREVKV